MREVKLGQVNVKPGNAGILALGGQSQLARGASTAVSVFWLPDHLQPHATR